MTPEEIQKDLADKQLQIDSLAKAFKDAQTGFVQHTHNGFDSSVVRFDSVVKDAPSGDIGDFFGKILRYLRRKIDAVFYFSIYPNTDNDTHLSIGTEFSSTGTLVNTTRLKTISLVSRQDININSRDPSGDGIVNIYAGGAAVNSGAFVGLDNANIDFDIAAATSGRLGVRKRNGELVFRFPNLSGVPATCTVGEICVASGKLQICTATNTWTIVGTQT